MLPLLNQNIDSDVDAEIQKVKEMSREQIRDSNLVLQGLTKYYGKMLAVNQLYLDVERRECFGLLGEFLKMVLWFTMSIRFDIS